MKHFLIILWCGLLVWAAPACAQRTLKNPKALGCLNVSGGELKASKVVFADTATTVQFTMDYPAGYVFRIAGTCYLVDENNRRYLVRSAEGLTLDAWVTSPADRTTHFTLHFEPLPKRTRVFDFIEYDGQRAFMLLSIHDSKQKLKMKTMEELASANVYPSLADASRAIAPKLDFPPSSKGPTKACSISMIWSWWPTYAPTARLRSDGRWIIPSSIRSVWTKHCRA